MKKRLLCGLLWLLVFAALPGHALEDGELQQLQRTVTDVDQELQQVERDIQRDRERLQRAELDLRASTITPAILEDARLELVSLQARKNGLETRLKARRDALAQLSRQIGDTEIRIQRGTDDDAELKRWQQELLDMQQTQGVLESLIDKIERLHHRYQTRSALARQYFNLLQARFELPDLDTARQSPGRAGTQLQQQVIVQLAEASAARREAAGLGQDEPRDKAQRRLLELQALVAEARAEFLQQSIARLQMERVLQSLSGFSGSLSTPVRILKTVLRNLDKMQEEVQQQLDVATQVRAQFQEQRQIINQQGAIVTGAESTLPARLALIDELTATADEQLAAIASLGERINNAAAGV